MLQQSEVVSLLLALSLAPVIFASVRNRAFTGKRAFVVATLAMVFSYAATVLEGVMFPVFFNALEHAFLALSGLGFAIALTQHVQSEFRAKNA